MANTDQDSILLSESNTREEVRVSVPPADEGAGSTAANQEVSNVSETISITSSSVTPKDSNPTPTSAEARPANTPARPTLVQLGAQSSTSTSHPHKKFNAVNINKKFLEKNSAAAMATTSSASASNKSTNSMSRPQMQSTQSHSRLVTAKLTGSPVPTTTTGPGWSRPTSTAPSSTGTNSPIGSSPLPTAAVPISVNSVAPQLPHVGKVIQPQPKTATLHGTNLQKESAKQSARLAWANVRTPAAPPVMTSEEFPTAAEVAQAMATRRPKTDDQKTTPESAESASAKHRLAEEADTFRGVHLDPNAHHWDEMEEDNDDFLGGVIEFGDGRQYKVEASDPPTSPPASEQAVSKEDRFVDDFDRSWPKSKSSPTSSVPDFPATSPALSSRGTSVHDFTHPQLFNERSNRLEPYSHSPRMGQSAPHNRRGSHNDGSVQLLQKVGNGEAHSRSRAGLGPGFIGDRRDGGSRKDHPSSPRLTRHDWGHHEMSPSNSLQGRDREPSERGRRSDMGPPPVPLHATRRLSQESGRQLPPRFSPNAPLPRRLPSRDRENRFPLPSSPHSSRFGPPSPALSHASTLVLSPSALSSIGLPGADLDEVTKDLMQSAAARAKARKQQEEAEREAQKERARRKAAELEEKLKAAEVEKHKEVESVSKEEETKIADREVVAFLENSVSGVDGSKAPLSPRPSIDSASHPKHIPRRTTSQRGLQRRMTSESVVPPNARRPSFGIGTRAAVPETSLASQSDSWRVKANPLPPTSPRHAHAHPRSSPSLSDATKPAPTTLVVPSTALEEVANIAEGSMTDLEVVDFTNMDKFVGNEEGVKEKVEVVSEVEKVETTTEVKPDVVAPKQRMTASDFFEDGKPTSAPKSENVWRRKISAASGNESEERSRPVKDETPVRATGSMPNLPSSSHPRIRPHNEASMSTIDDVMSRIRGAIEASASSKETRPQEGPSEPEQPHPRQPPASTAAPKTPSHTERPQPPPPRLQVELRLEELRESLDTVTDFLHSPPSGNPTIQLPSVSHHIAPVPKRQHFGFSKAPYPARFELLSFEPPVQGMSKRDFSVNSVLFRQQASYKGSRIRVALPRSRPGPALVRTVSIGPKFSSAGAFGKSTNADGATSWRRSFSAKGEERDGDVDGDKASDGGRSQESKPVEPPLEEPQPHVKLRQPKMPAGSVVAFMRDQRIDAVEADPKPLVNFIVSSELDGLSFEALSEVEVEKVGTPVESQTSSGDSGNLPLVAGAKVDTDTSKSRPSPPLITTQLPEHKNEDESASHNASAPSPSHHTTAPSTPWGRASSSLPIKDSTVRAPDPEHLKAVWSQPANKSDLNPVNSLEGIADDLIPFSIQDVKSEDGETPPPALPPATSRMSLHEVTKAFQKVPASSSSSSTPSRNHISPPSSNSTPASRSPYPYAPMPPNSMRPPHYDPYSPMLSHSPAPTVIYPHQLTPSPVPNRMTVNGHPPMYQGAVWMPAPAPGNPMRPMMTPYAGPMMTYATPGTPVYAPMGAMPGAPQQAPVGTAPGRGRGVPMMSPAMSHAHALPGTPMYAGSPVMMPVPPHTHQNHAPYLNVHPQPGGTPGRGQGRTDMPQPSQSQNGQQQPHHPPTYNPAAASFIRSTW